MSCACSWSWDSVNIHKAQQNLVSHLSLALFSLIDRFPTALDDLFFREKILSMFTRMISNPCFIGCWCSRFSWTPLSGARTSSPPFSRTQQEKQKKTARVLPENTRNTQNACKSHTTTRKEHRMRCGAMVFHKNVVSGCLKTVLNSCNLMCAPLYAGRGGELSLIETDQKQNTRQMKANKNISTSKKRIKQHENTQTTNKMSKHYRQLPNK